MSVDSGASDRHTAVGKRRAVFIDRDGTINVEKEYLHRPEEFEFIPGAAEAIRILGEAGFIVVVVTNQSGVARGFYTEDDVRSLHRYMDHLLVQVGARVDAYYFCPHHPDNGIGKYRIACNCRKPLPGMLQQAAGELGIDLRSSWMIGDKLADLEAGNSAGCRSALVLTGYGATEQLSLPAATAVFSDLLAAAEAILSETV
ncbi:D-glycero-alpha-D-manno-heptose-1,7-bisphosphate 7-phosphatase [Geobacter sp. OR-1]|uniref:D-glycero-beta-D-manno-heptose 1,7-bisphosphate 7-phosphatase n=1 Tax=Geobacter sp. OR-1 TaxID=1266765 RepID=UPI0005433CF1|nr:D-glycero-beta-D-manno-heptose 1,7-bisphosphate 7-phosphatase [Geobacter sp. OR-1]GAM08173.1 D-glycero-alpha-D-manno-heptose-1,7-bisphosphate 7-phosphatase [Geobacter sp. OR-1]